LLKRVQLALFVPIVRECDDMDRVTCAVQLTQHMVRPDPVAAIRRIWDTVRQIEDPHSERFCAA
jgi:hypothetical protein